MIKEIKPVKTCKVAQALPSETLRQLNEMKKKLPKGVDKAEKK